MTSSPTSSGDRPSSAEDAYALLLKLRESGSAPDFEVWVRAYPEFERELRALEASWASIQDSIERVLASTVIVPPEPLVPSLEAGLTVGEFTLVRRIGVGGMGVVWLARQPALDRHVALKFVRPDRETAQSALLFAREARAAARVHDRRIATVYAVGESGGHRWIAQEYVPGSRGAVHWLRELHDAGIPPDHDRRVAAFVADVAEALHAAHEQGVVHRDVKPQNLLMAADGSPRITDFGLARLLDEVPLSESLNIRGTVEYSSPEQVTGSPDIDARSDVFSLGVVLYELLALERPFPGLTLLEVIAAITVREARPPSAVRPGIPRDLDVIVLKALEKQPDARYATALELARDLRRWLAHEPIAARPPSLLQRFTKWLRRHPTHVSLAGVGVLLLGVATWGLRWRGEIVEGRKDLNVQRMHFAINDGRMDAAQSEAAAFLALDDDDPEAHLVLAMGYARFLRFAEAEEQLALAEQAGYDPELGAQPTAEDAYRRALWLVSQRDAGQHAEAADLLERAASSEEHKDFVWFPLYQMRKSIGARDGARAALVEFIGTLRVGDDFTSIAEALLAELDGEHLRAVEILEGVRERVTDERERELRLHRHLGRNAFLAYAAERPARSDLLDLAEDALRLAVLEHADDANAWATLGLVLQHRAKDVESDGARRRELRAEAEACAVRASSQPGELASAALLNTGLAFDDLWDAFNPHARQGGQRSAQDSAFNLFKQRVEDLRRVDPENSNLPLMDSYVHFFSGALAELDGRLSDAAAAWADAVEASPLQFFARVKLGQACYDTKEFARGADLLAEALAIWDHPQPFYAGIDRAAERKWLFATSAWIVGMADRADDVPAAREARERVLRELETDDRDAAREEMLSLAEFLAQPVHDELRDCDVALDLVNRHDLESFAKGSPALQAIVASILQACG